MRFRGVAGSRAGGREAHSMAVWQKIFFMFLVFYFFFLGARKIFFISFIYSMETWEKIFFYFSFFSRKIASTIISCFGLDRSPVLFSVLAFRYFLSLRYFFLPVLFSAALYQMSWSKTFFLIFSGFGSKN